jgi:hypothetical protein
MSEMFVGRRADGGLFAEDKNGTLKIPMWSSQEALARYRERNPVLMTFLSTPLTSSLINKLLSGFEDSRIPEFILLHDDDPDADLEDGTPISLDEALRLVNAPVGQLQN